MKKLISLKIRNKLFEIDSNMVFLDEFSISKQNATKSNITELIP